MSDNPATISTWHDSNYKYTPYFLKSAARYGITIHNADNSSWGGPDWRDIQWYKKTLAQIKFVREHPEFTHFMFTDSHDFIFAAGWDEILFKYRQYDSPIVFGSECYPWPKPEQASLYPPWPGRCRYLNAGFWIGTAPAALSLLEVMEQKAVQKIQCDQGFTVDLFLSGKHPIKLDNKCSLLHCCNMDSLEFLRQHGDRIINTETNELPCCFHGNGASPLQKIIEWLKL